MMKKVLAGVLAFGLFAASVAPSAMAQFGIEKGVILYNPITGDVDTSNCIPGNQICWYKSQ